MTDLNASAPLRDCEGCRLPERTVRLRPSHEYLCRECWYDAQGSPELKGGYF